MIYDYQERLKTPKHLSLGTLDKDIVLMSSHSCESDFKHLDDSPPVLPSSVPQAN